MGFPEVALGLSKSALPNIRWQDFRNLLLRDWLSMALIVPLSYRKALYCGACPGLHLPCRSSHCTYARTDSYAVLLSSAPTTPPARIVLVHNKCVCLLEPGQIAHTRLHLLHLNMDASTILSLVVREVTQNRTVTAKKPFRCTTVSARCPIERGIVRYQPTIAGNTIYGVCFILLLLAQIYFGMRKKTWTYMAAVCLGIFGEIVGYIGRLMLNKNPFDMNNFLV